MIKTYRLFNTNRMRIEMTWTSNTFIWITFFCIQTFSDDIIEGIGHPTTITTEIAK
jgi:hypothetical protein